MDVGELRSGRADDQDRDVAAGFDDVIEQLQERRLGGVDVVDDDYEGSLGRLCLEELARPPEEFGHGVRGRRQADGRRDPVDDGLPVRVVGPEERRDPSAGGLRRVVLADAGRGPDDLDQRPEGDPFAVSEAAAAEDGRLGSDAPDEVGDESGLADAGITDDGHETSVPVLEDPLEGTQQPIHLGLSPDERGCRGLHRRRGGVADVDESERGDGLRLALEGQVEPLDLDLAADELVGDLADQDLAGRRVLFEPGGDVDRVAGRQVLVGVRVGVGDDLAGVDPGPAGDLNAVDPGQLLVQRRERLLHAEGCPDGTERVVLVGPDQAEHGHDRVADVLLDLTAVPFDLDGHRPEVASLDLVHRLGVDRARQGRRVLEVGEDEGHELADLGRRQDDRLGDRGRRRRPTGRDRAFRGSRCSRGQARRRERRAAEPAQPELGRVLLAAVGATDRLRGGRERRPAEPAEAELRRVLLTARWAANRVHGRRIRRAAA